MALNFPPVDAGDGNPTDGMIWTAPNGRQWKYNASVPGWTSLAATGNSNIVYRGGLDLTRDPDDQYADIVSGNQFVVTTGADPVSGSLYPGLGGKTVAEGAIAMYDGNRWTVTSNLPYATEDQPGIVELATTAEAIDETNPRVVLTPQRGAEMVDARVPQASTTVVGKTRYATQVEAAAGTETEAALTPASIKDLVDKILENEKHLTPTGMIAWMPVEDKSLIPAGWMLCDGTRIYETGETEKLYQQLSLWGNAFGNGPNSDVVRVPDLLGRFIRGYHYDDDTRDPDLTDYGTPQSDAFASHTHGISDPGHDHTISGNGYNAGASAPGPDVIVDNNTGTPNQSDTNNSLTGVSVQAAGHTETRPKNISLTPVIKL